MLCIHLGKGEEAFACVFQRCADKIDYLIIYNHKTVMENLRSMQFQTFVLRIKTLCCQLKSFTDFFGVNIYTYSNLFLTHHRQNRFIHIIIYQQNGVLGGFNQTLNKLKCIEYLPVHKDPLARR